jgi:hypothetical protein
MKYEELDVDENGTTYLIEKDNKKYILKATEFFDKSSFMWNVINFHKFVDTLDADKQKYFSKMYGYLKRENCGYVLTDYLGDIILLKYVKENDVDEKLFYKIARQIVDINKILDDNGYIIWGFSMQHIMVVKEFQLVLFNYYEILQKKDEKGSFENMYNMIRDILFNKPKYEFGRSEFDYKTAVYINDNFGDYWNKTMQELKPEHGSLDNIEYTIKQNAILKFSMDYPDKYVYITDAKEYHPPILPRERCIEFLKIHDIEGLMAFLN